MEAEAYRAVASVLIPRWSSSTYYSIAQFDPPQREADFVYAREVCIDVIGPPRGLDWNGTVHLKARDVRFHDPINGWGRSRGPQDVDVLEVRMEG
jgi:hypothetical protein